MSDNPMILVSNHLLQYEDFKFPLDAVVRVNLAWIENAFALEAVVCSIQYDVFLDFPESRKKPPVPTITYSEMIEVVKEYKNVKYVAVSNVEDGAAAGARAKALPKGVEFVPKIETERGIRNLIETLVLTKSKYIMLDTEDLFMNVKGDVKKYNHLINCVRAACEYKDVAILKIQGVVFAPWVD